MGEPLNKIGYHVHALREAGCIELVKTEHRRGAVAHFYRQTTRAFLTDEQGAGLPLGIRRGLVAQTLADVMADARAAAEDDGFDHDQVHVTRTRLELDDEGFEAMVELLNQTLERALEIQSESVNRRAASNGEAAADAPAPHRTLLGMLHFHRP
jgi:hypothetical protein